MRAGLRSVAYWGNDYPATFVSPARAEIEEKVSDFTVGAINYDHQEVDESGHFFKGLFYGLPMAFILWTVIIGLFRSF